jgi:hypothetical protein
VSVVSTDVSAGRRVIGALPAQPIYSLADMGATADYLLGYPGDNYLISDEDELVLFLGQ